MFLLKELGPMNRPVVSSLPIFFVVLLVGVVASAQIQPAPPNRPDRPILPDKPYTPTTVDDNDSHGYCIVGGDNSEYCAKFNEDCVPIPTSLRVPVIPFRFDIVGWESSPNASGCGTESCMLIFRCECGATLLDRVCGV
jgi:hypothetical protein